MEILENYKLTDSRMKGLIYKKNIITKTVKQEEKNIKDRLFWTNEH